MKLQLSPLQVAHAVLQTIGRSSDRLCPLSLHSPRDVIQMGCLENRERENSLRCLPIFPHAVFQNLKHVAWFKERSISDLSLGGLLILVVIRTIQYNMTRMRVSASSITLALLLSAFSSFSRFFLLSSHYLAFSSLLSPLLPFSPCLAFSFSSSSCSPLPSPRVVGWWVGNGDVA
jgi:hypothetical protein